MLRQAVESLELGAGSWELVTAFSASCSSLCTPHFFRFGRLVVLQKRGAERFTDRVVPDRRLIVAQTIFRLDGLDPLNILRWLPQQGRYSPLWDVHLAAWATTPRRITQYDDVADLARAGDVSGPGGAPFGAVGFIVNCPIIALVG